MVRFFNRQFICVVLFFLISFSQPVVGSSQAEKLTTVLPDDVLGFVATSGGDELKPAFEKSILGRMWNDPGVQTFYQSLKKEILTKIKQEMQDPNEAKAFDTAQELIKLACKRPKIIGAAQKKVESGPPVYGFAILEAGALKAEISSAIAKMESFVGDGDIIEVSFGSVKMHGLKDDCGVPGYWGWVGNYLVLAVNDSEGLAIKYLSNPREAVGEYLKKIPGTNDALVMYVDSGQIGAVVNAATEQEGSSEQFKSVAAAIKELGLSEVKTIAARAGFIGPDVVSRGLLDSPQREAGIFANYKDIKLSQFDMVDARAVNASAVNCDIAGIYDTIMKAAEAALPDNRYAEVQQAISGFEAQAQFEIRNGLLESLAGQAVFYSLPAGAMMEAPSGGFVIVAELKDAVLWKKAMFALEKFAQANSNGMLQVSPQLQSDGRALHCWMVAPLAMMQVMPCWTVVDNHVVIASNVGLSNIAVKQISSADSEAKSIRTTEGFKKIAAKLPESMVSLRYVDSKVQFNQMMMQVQQFWPMMTMFASQRGIKLPAMLPSVADVIKDAGPSYEYSRFDTDGLVSYYQGPGVEVSLGAVAGASLSAGVIMPALARVRQTAHTMSSGAKLSGIGRTCLVYSNDYEDKYPPNLQELVEKEDLHPDILESPLKPKGFDGPSYIYIAGQTTTMHPGNIIAYDNPAFCREKINVLFNDCHVRAMKPDEFLRELEATYKRLGREMPEVKFKDSVRRGPEPVEEAVPMPVEKAAPTPPEE